MSETNAHQRQCVWIIRYGLTEYPLEEGRGPYDSDIDPTEGVLHAKAIAGRIASSGPDVPAVVFASPFLRTAHTADIIARALSGNVRVRVEEGLTEWLTPSLLVEPNGRKTEPRSLEQLWNLFPDTVEKSYESVNPVVPDDWSGNNVPAGSPRFVESEDALLIRCEVTLRRILDAVAGQNIAIVSHAPCDQAMALFLEGGKSPSESKLSPWALGGITMFSRSVGPSYDYGEWRLELYSDTAHMPGEYEPGIKKWSLPCLS